MDIKKMIEKRITALAQTNDSLEHPLMEIESLIIDYISVYLAAFGSGNLEGNKPVTTGDVLAGTAGDCKAE